jgi:hypothetical protein
LSVWRLVQKSPGEVVVWQKHWELKRVGLRTVTGRRLFEEALKEWLL